MNQSCDDATVAAGGDQVERAALRGDGVASPIRPLSARDRQLYRLTERVAELELALRERSEIDLMHDLELRSMQLDFELKASYVRRLETQQGELHAEIGRQEADRAKLFNALEETRRQLAEVGALAAALQSRRSYRLLLRCIAFARTVLYPVRLARRIVRRVIRR
jgi:hypothetical protein